MDSEQMQRGWSVLAAEVGQELAEWRVVHPRATLAKIEQATQEALRRMQARYLNDLVHASPAADLTSMQRQERPRCRACGGELAARGQRERLVVTPGQVEPLRLRRSYGVCRACESGVFPP